MASSSTDLLSNKKREHLRQLEKLRREATKAERECRLQAVTIHHRKGNGSARDNGNRQDEGNPSSLDVDMKRLSTEREAELKRLCQQLTDTKMGVKKFKESVGKSRQRLPPSPAVLEDLKSKMVEIESSISAFKAKQKSIYDDLNRNELQCSNEIASLEKKMVAWEQQRPLSARGGGGGGASARPFTAAGDVNGDLPPAVVTFERFQQQSGGVCGGWIEEDHSIFLRVRLKHKGKSPAFIDEAMPLLAPRSVDDLRSHEEWYREHEKLLEAKKAAIDEWKKRKLVRQKEESDSYRETEQGENERKRQMDAEKRERDEKEKRQKEAEVAAWKEAKEAEKVKETEEKLAQEAEAKRKEEAKAARMAQVKVKAEEFARERDEAKRVAAEAEARKERIDRERKRKIAVEEILKFQERDQMTVAQRIVFNQRRAEEEAERAKRLEKMKENVAVKAERDPDRLVRLTKGMEERKRVKEEEEEDVKRRGVQGVRNCGGANFNVKQIQHRMTPSWRAGV